MSTRNPSSPKDNIRAVAALVVSPKGEFILQYRDNAAPIYPSLWSPFGGGIEEGEGPLDALTRELKEEIGIDVLPERLKYLENILVNPEKDKWMSLYRLDLNDGEEIILGEGGGYGFFKSKEVLLELALTPRFKEAIVKYI